MENSNDGADELKKLRNYLMKELLLKKNLKKEKAIVENEKESNTFKGNRYHTYGTNHFISYPDGNYICTSFFWYRN